jgi:hypothetical protein
MSQDFSELIKAIEEKNYPKAHATLDSMMSHEPEFSNFSKVQVVIMLAALKSDSLNCLSLINHPFCHGDWYENDHLKSAQSILAKMIVKEGFFEAIEHSILKGLTSMSLVTSQIINAANNQAITYILNHPKLEFDYAQLKYHYVALFRDSNHIETILQLKDKLYHTPMLVNDCIHKSIESKNIVGLEYLFNHHSIVTQQVFSYFLEYIETSIKDINYSFNDLSQLSFDDDHSSFSNKKQMNSHDFLCQFYTLLKDKIGFENNEKMTQYFIKPYINNPSGLDNLFDSVYEILDIIYPNATAPNEIISSFEEKCNTVLNGKNRFADFQVCYEKRKFDTSVNSSSKEGNKLKL